MKSHPRLKILAVMLLFTGCAVNLKPVQMNTDPNEIDRHKASDQIEQGNIEAFIKEHPELDEETKRQLRAGILTRPEALKKLEKKK